MSCKGGGKKHINKKNNSDDAFCSGALLCNHVCLYMCNHSCGTNHHDEGVKGVSHFLMRKTQNGYCLLTPWVVFVVGVWMCARVVYAWMSTCVCVCACLCTQKKTIHTFLSLSFSSARCRASASFCSCSRLRCASASSCNRFYREGEKNYTQDHESMFLNLVADNFIHAIYKKSIAWKVLYPVCIEWVKVLLFIKQITTIHNSSFTLFVSLSWERYYPRYPF